jgi:hypothetical protein
MQFSKSTASFQLSIAIVTIVAIGCCLVPAAHLGGVEAAQPVFQQETQLAPLAARVPVLIEFFPSAECPTCSAVDAELAHIEREQPVSAAQVIVMRENADLMEEADPNFHYASELFSERQRGYQEIFMKDSLGAAQVVVNGAVVAKGSSNRQIEGAIAEAIKEANVTPLQFAGVRLQSRSVGFTLRDCPEISHYVNVIAALVDPVSSEVRAVDGSVGQQGQLSGPRSFGIVGSSFRTKAVVGNHFSLPFYLRGAGSNLRGVGTALEGKRLVVLVQTKQVGPVIGIASCTIHLATSQAAGTDRAFPADPCPISDSL